MSLETDHLPVVNVAVSPVCQGQGYGRALLAHADELARSHGFSDLDASMPSFDNTCCPLAALWPYCAHADALDDEDVRCSSRTSAIGVDTAKTGVRCMTDTALQSSVDAEAPHSYDECLALLAHAVRQHDEAQLDQVAELIGELAVVIEL